MVAINGSVAVGITVSTFTEKNPLNYPYYAYSIKHPFLRF
jgi:hypothetical protein